MVTVLIVGFLVRLWVKIRRLPPRLSHRFRRFVVVAETGVQADVLRATSRGGLLQLRDFPCSGGNVPALRALIASWGGRPYENEGEQPDSKAGCQPDFQPLLRYALMSTTPNGRTITASALVSQSSCLALTSGRPVVAMSSQGRELVADLSAISREDERIRVLLDLSRRESDLRQQEIRTPAHSRRHRRSGLNRARIVGSRQSLRKPVVSGPPSCKVMSATRSCVNRYSSANSICDIVV